MGDTGKLAESASQSESSGAYNEALRGRSLLFVLETESLLVAVAEVLLMSDERGDVMHFVRRVATLCIGVVEAEKAAADFVRDGAGLCGCAGRVSAARIASFLAPKSLLQLNFFFISDLHASSQAKFAIAAAACVITAVSLTDSQTWASTSVPPAAHICRHIAVSP
mmetsp:Transcript_27194/g.43630  ORF Transcript_27194/g.43630 Transcript_27194/m.43630 type:complete len:166 (-) Transcript_27194:1851-2348(-)